MSLDFYLKLPTRKSRIIAIMTNYNSNYNYFFNISYMLISSCYLFSLPLQTLYRSNPDKMTLNPPETIITVYNVPGNNIKIVPDKQLKYYHPYIYI